MTTVYRIQDKNGEGPYVGVKPVDISEMLLQHDACPYHPPPDVEFGYGATVELLEATDWRCGFLTESQLHEWFTDEILSRLVEAGFDVVLVSNVNILLGNEYSLQVVFEMTPESEITVLERKNYVIPERLQDYCEYSESDEEPVVRIEVRELS